MEHIFNIATKVSTPLAISGFVAAAFFLILRQLIARGVFPQVQRHHSAKIIILIIERLFTLSLVALVLGFAGYVVALFAPKTSAPSPISANVLRIVVAGLPENSHPVVDLSHPVSEQVRLYPEDKVRVVGLSDTLRQVWFGDNWHSFDFDRDYNRQFTVMGPEGKPVIPQFEGTGMVKLEISFTRYRDRPRDIRPRAGNVDSNIEINK